MPKNVLDEVSKITALKLNLDSVPSAMLRKGFIYLNYVLTCSSTNLFYGAIFIGD